MYEIKVKYLKFKTMRHCGAHGFETAQCMSWVNVPSGRSVPDVLAIEYHTSIDLLSSIFLVLSIVILKLVSNQSQNFGITRPKTSPHEQALSDCDEEKLPFNEQKA